MNKKPVSYLQTDPRWKNKPYRVPGETATIGGSGCGPACAAMVIATLADKSVTPVETCAWSVDHGYKALNQGTYYSYFRPQLAEYGIRCKQLLASRILNKPEHPVHEEVRRYLEDGYYVIALMGPGTWTRSGHFVLVWAWDDKVRINDPASAKAVRRSGDPETFRREVRCYWLVDAREHNKVNQDHNKVDQDHNKDPNKEEIELTEQQVRAIVRDEYAKLEAERAKLPCGYTGPVRELYNQALSRKLMDGSRPQSYATRQEVALMVNAAVGK